MRRTFVALRQTLSAAVPATRWSVVSACDLEERSHLRALIVTTLLCASLPAQEHPTCVGHSLVHVALKEELQFELHALTDIFNWSGALPELAVSARGTWQSPGVPKESGTLPNHSRDEGQHGEEPWIHGHAHHVNGRSPLLYVWSLEKFLSRLAAMREINQECAQSDIESVRRRLSQFPFQNPWIEMSFADSRSLGEQNHPSHGLYLDSPSSILSPFEDGSGRTDWRRRLSTDLQGISDELDLSLAQF